MRTANKGEIILVKNFEKLFKFRNLILEYHAHLTA